MDQSTAALELLYDMISSKRTRNVNLSFLEPIILRFVELSVSLRKGKIVKDGLHQYKKIVQPNSIQSIEVVVKRFLELSEQKVTQAQERADKITLDADDDLEAADSPEDILMATVSSEQTRDRTDREVVTPWLKFLWEAYRSTLDVLRNNSRLEVLYQTVVKQAFDFCFRYTRKTEFRRLCELLRNHLQTAAAQAKNAGQTNPIDFSDPDTLQRYLDTRFDQLNVAVKLELWQEAFRSVEDVHTLLTVSKRPAKVSTMANYFENLARIFLVSGNNLFHAAAWSRYYSLVLQARSVPEQELTRIASLLMLSVLAIPTGTSQQHSRLSGEVDDQKHRNTRLTGLLNLSKTPTREGLLKSALSKNVLVHVRPEIKDLYKILEVDFHPLSIKTRLGPVLEKIGKDVSYKPYVKSLYQVILTRLFQQLSQVYKSVKLDFVVQLATFPAPFNTTPVEIEKFIVRGCQKGEFGIRIDHESSSITFKDDIYDVSSRFNEISAQSTTALQATPSEIVRTQLSRLGRSLYAAINVVDPIYVEYKASSRKAVIERAVAGIDRENVDVLERQEKIEMRQKDAEAEQLRREEEEAKERLLRIQQEQQAEQQRLAEEARKRELERLEREREAIKEEAKRRVAEEINAKGIIKIDLDTLENVDMDRLRIMQVQQLDKAQKDLNERLRIIGRRLDHMERAYRLEEIELWEKDAELQQQRDIKLYEARKAATLQKSKEQHEEALALKARLERIVPDYEIFRKEVEAKRKDIFEAKKKENQRLLEEEKKRRIAQVKAQRERERLQREAEEKERKVREELEKKEAEERARLADEEQKKPAVYRPGALRGSLACRAVSNPAGPAANGAAAAPEPSRVPANRAVSMANSMAAGGTRPTAVRPSSNPFGNARPVTVPDGVKPYAPAPAPAAPKPGKYVPPSLRGKHK